MIVEETFNSNNMFLVSVCGMDFAGREHDIMDIKRYIKNWDKVFGTLDGELVPPNGRDFAPTGQKAILHQTILLEDLIKMARLRLQAQDRLGIQIAGEVGLGLGVFAGDMIGIGDQVRRLSVKALRRVLEKEGSFFKNIKAVICCMPVFKPRDNYHYFVEGFKGYKGVLPVWILDQDMHSVTRTAAKFFKTSELNPADSHGVFGEYWQNRGPGTEEKLALTTAGLLVQHHAINGRMVLNPERYHFIDVAKPLND
ncbi:SRR1 domain-containing protein [Balamuthia mandrillaris]